MRLNRLLAGTLLLAAAVAAQAQIRIGQTAGFTGAVAAGVKETSDGARLYLDAVNARGGINGQRIELVQLDDKFEPKLAAENARKLIDQGVLALFLNRGTPHTQAILPLLAEHRIALVAPSTGAAALHQPVNTWVFNVRATYQREAERVVRHLLTIGVTHIAIVQVDDSFGSDAVLGAQAAFAQTKIKPVAYEKYDRSKPDFSAIVPKLMQADPQAVLFIASGAHMVEGVQKLRAAGSRAQMVTLSNNASSGFIKSLGEFAHGTIVSQVFPYERSIAVPIVQEAQELSKAKGAGNVTPSTLEGFAAAKVLVEGLRRAGKNLTRSGLRDALEGMKRVDIGGLEVSYGPTDHTGLEYADLSIIGADGRFRR